MTSNADLLHKRHRVAEWGTNWRAVVCWETESGEYEGKEVAGFSDKDLAIAVARDLRSKAQARGRKVAHCQVHHEL